MKGVYYRQPNGKIQVTNSRISADNQDWPGGWYDWNQSSALEIHDPGSELDIINSDILSTYTDVHGKARRGHTQRCLSILTIFPQPILVHMRIHVENPYMDRKNMENDYTAPTALL